jgi:SAM-dependent methyltransferase
VDVRDCANPVLTSARRWLDRVNARHPWNHNEHFHGWILRNLPSRRRAAVDVGCGTGVLAAKLARHFARVTGIDADAGMAAAANARLAQDPRATICHCGFEQFASAAGEGETDLITMVAVLHRPSPPFGVHPGCQHAVSGPRRSDGAHDSLAPPACSERLSLAADGKSGHGPVTPPVLIRAVVNWLG